MIFNLVGRVLRMVVKLALLAFGLVVMLGLLFLAAAGLLVALLRSVLTGRKPVAFSAFSQFRQFRQTSQFRWGGQSGNGTARTAHTGQSGRVDGANGVAHVVDVQAYEVGTQPDRPVAPAPSIHAPQPLLHKPKGRA